MPGCSICTWAHCDPEPGKKKLFFSADPWAVAFTSESGSGNAYVVSSGSDLLVKLNVDASGEITFTGDISTTRYVDLNNPTDPATSGAKAGKNPLGIVIRNIAPGNNRAFVLNYISRNISVVDLDTDVVTQVIAVTALPPAGSQEEQLQVGKEIFFASHGHFNSPSGTTVPTDERLSSEGWQNCASCISRRSPTAPFGALVLARASQCHSMPHGVHTTRMTSVFSTIQRSLTKSRTLS